MAHTATNLLVHLIFSTRKRAPLINPQIESDLHAYLGGIVRESGVALSINGMSDHVHLLVRVPASHSVAGVARVIKCNSSRWVHERWPQHRAFAWQTGYAAFSVSESGAGVVRDYISSQRQHHTQRSFEEEFMIFLKKNHISVDERYLWD
ncbi:MAG TPA: IS200/IS605 family transposase [Candidatus Sulfotelmatobacter sp.]